MYKLSKASNDRLSTCDPRIQEIVKQSIKTSPLDFGIPRFGGMRTAEEQKKLFIQGLSQLDGTVRKSYHQTGLAFDIYAYVGKASWNAKHLTLIAGHIIGTANRLGYKLTWGGDWDSDGDYSDQKFNDLVHFQLEE